MELTQTQNLAVDLLLLAFDRENHTIKLYTPKREVEPAIGVRALPGVLVKYGEHLSSAVKRTLEEKTPLKTLTDHLQELPARTNPERDKRGHVVSIPILVLLPDYQNFNDDWSTFTPNMDLAFDHAEMVNLAYKVLKNNWDKHPLPLLLAGEKTTLEEAKDILVHFQPYYSKVLPSNLRQMTFVDKFLQETDESEKNEQKGRPKKLYRVKTEQINPLYT